MQIVGFYGGVPWTSLIALDTQLVNTYAQVPPLNIFAGNKFLEKCNKYPGEKLKCL